ncbi:MAG: helix-turn-helix domain-containing protein [Bacilli bacterium]
MKEIGEQLRQAREEIGLSIEEVSQDLKLTLKQIKSIEEGDKEGLRDILDLKLMFLDYAKYLGLETDVIENSFNEFMFEYTSKIPLDEIKKANEEKKEEEKNIKRIASPYTKEIQKKYTTLKILIWIIIIFLLLILLFFIKEMII